MAGIMARQPSTTVTTTIAPGANRQGWVAGLGVLLLVVNFYFTQEGLDVFTAILPVHAPSADRPHVTLIELAGQSVMLLILVGIAGIDDQAGSAALLFVAALWVGWLLHNISLVSGLVGLLPGAQKTNSYDSFAPKQKGQN